MLYTLKVYQDKSDCWQVVPDLERFMESMNQKMATIYENIKVLENPANPPPMERYSLKL